MDNPFTQIYNALWTGAERNKAITDYIRAGNRIKYDVAIGDKEQINENDLPELALISTGMTSNIMETSSTTLVVKNYTWFISTGEYDINEFLNPISWELLRCMVDWDKFLCSLTWPDENWHFIIRLNVADTEEGTMMSNLSRNIKGWAAAMTLDVMCCFRTDDMRIVI